jgi:hypothetical protein
MLVFIGGGDNYVEAATVGSYLKCESEHSPLQIGFRDSLWYSLFFIFCTVMGLFFITSLMIEAFCGSYEEDQKVSPALSLARMCRPPDMVTAGGLCHAQT